MPLFGTGAVTFTGTQFTELAAAIPEFSKQTGYTQDGILGAGGTYAIQNNGVAVAVYQHSATPPNANYSVWADIAKLSGNTGTGPRMGVCGRMAAGAETFYFAIYSHNLTNIRLFKVVAGAQTQLGSSYTYTLTGTAAKLELVMDGSNISVKLNDTTVIGPVTDTAITAAGKAGIYLFDMRETGVADAGSIDNFDAAAVTLPSAFGAGATLAAVVAAGSLTTTASGFTSAATLGAVVAAGSLGATAGTITSEPLRTNNGTLLASVALSYVAVYNQATGALVVRRTGVSTNGSGVFSFSDPAIAAGTTYRVDWETAAGQRRMPLATAA